MRCCCFVVVVIAGCILGVDSSEKLKDTPVSNDRQFIRDIPVSNDRQFIREPQFHEEQPQQQQQQLRPQFEQRPRQFELIPNHHHHPHHPRVEEEDERPRFIQPSLDETRHHQSMMAFRDARFQDPRFRQFVEQPMPQQEFDQHMFKSQNTFALPLSQFTPLRVRENPTRNAEPPSPSTSVRNAGFPTTFFNMPFKAVSMTPFKVSTGNSQQNLLKTAENPDQPQQIKLIPEHSGESFRMPTNEAAFRRPEPEFMEQPPPSHFLRAQPEEFEPQPEFVPHPRPSQFSSSNFHRPMSSFSANPITIHQDALSFGPPITFQISPSSNLIDSSKTSVKNAEIKDESSPTKSENVNVKPTFSSTSGLQFKPFGIAPVQFEPSGTSGRDSLRSASFDDELVRQREPEMGSVPFRPIILRPVKLLSPSGSELLKTASPSSSTKDEFKAFMTVSEDDLKETLKGRKIQPTVDEFDTFPPETKSQQVRQRPSLQQHQEPPSQQPPHHHHHHVSFRRPPQMIRVRPTSSSPSTSSLRHESEVKKHREEDEERFERRPTQIRQHVTKIKPVVSFRSTPRHQSSSFVEYRIQPSLVDEPHVRRQPISKL